MGNILYFVPFVYIRVDRSHHDPEFHVDGRKLPLIRIEIFKENFYQISMKFNFVIYILNKVNKNIFPSNELKALSKCES